MGYPYGTIARLLLLTGQRRGEIANMAKHQIDRAGRMLTIPIRSTKSRRGHLVPLSDLAMDVLNEVPRLPGRVAVFGRDGVKPPGSASFYEANQRLNRRMREICRAEVAATGGDLDDANVEYLTYHDLRRTAATVMCRLGHPVEFVDRVMHHAGGRTGIGRTVNACTRIYVKHEFMDQRRAALRDLGTYIEKLVGGLHGKPLTCKRHGKVLTRVSERGQSTRTSRLNLSSRGDRSLPVGASGHTQASVLQVIDS